MGWGGSLSGCSICRPSLLEETIQGKIHPLFTVILYETCVIGIFSYQEVDLVPFRCFTSLLVDKYTRIVRTAAADSRVTSRGSVAVTMVTATAHSRYY